MSNSLSAFLSLVVLAISAPSAAVAQSTEHATGHVVEIEVPAPSLAGNLLGTPDSQSAAVYLPPSYDQQNNHRYPVIVLLHGIFDDHGVWLENVGVPAILDRLIASNDLPETLVVMPNGGNQYGGGFYRNSPVSGNWGDYIADDLLGFIDQQFRTLPHQESRAIVGHSMGGYGALNLAMTRPGLFSTVWAMSPCCLAANDDLSFGNDAWKRAAAVASPEDVQALFESNDFYPIALLGVITAFSPAPEAAPIYGDFPFDIVRGEVILNEPVLDRYLDALPIRQVHDARANLRSLSGLALDVGLGDQFLHIPTSTLELSQRLGEERIPHRLDIYDGDHRQQVGERLESIILPWVGEHLVLQE
ncbi:MAG: alpha/beta hydrolase family protein [Hyphomicrobiales bacterium]